MYEIPTDSATIFELSPKKTGTTGWNRRISLQINDEKLVKKLDKTYFSKDLKALGASKMLTLEDILSITPRAFIKIRASGANSYSGSRRLFRSTDYKLADIVQGKYDRFSLELVSYGKEEDSDKDYYRSNSDSNA